MKSSKHKIGILVRGQSASAKINVVKGCLIAAFLMNVFREDNLVADQRKGKGYEVRAERAYNCDIVKDRIGKLLRRLLRRPTDAV